MCSTMKLSKSSLPCHLNASHKVEEGEHRTQTCIYVRSCGYVYVHVCIYIVVHVFLFAVWLSVCIFLYVYMHVFGCESTYVCMWTHVYVCLCRGCLCGHVLYYDFAKMKKCWTKRNFYQFKDWKWSENVENSFEISCFSLL